MRGAFRPPGAATAGAFQPSLTLRVLTQLEHGIRSISYAHSGDDGGGGDQEEFFHEVCFSDFVFVFDGSTPRAPQTPL